MTLAKRVKDQRIRAWIRSVKDMREFFDRTDEDESRINDLIAYLYVEWKKDLFPDVKITDPEVKEFVFEQMPKIPKSLIDHMSKVSVDCITKNPELDDHPFICESVYWTPQQKKGSYTLHTHTIAGVDYPSPADIQTTTNLKKKSLCIINTADQTLSCYSGKDFKTKSQRSI